MTILFQVEVTVWVMPMGNVREEWPLVSINWA